MLVHLPHKVVKFAQLGNGLYGLNPTKAGNSKIALDHMIFVETVEENVKFLLPRQIKHAKKAQKMFEAMGTPSWWDLKALIRMNLVKNKDVTTEDVNLGLKAYGPDVGEVKAKMTQHCPDPVQDRTIKIPDELLKVNEEV
eukprot:4548275-Ditylum_brightwellii.AAC.1